MNLSYGTRLQEGALSLLGKQMILARVFGSNPRRSAKLLGYGGQKQEGVLRRTANPIGPLRQVLGSNPTATASNRTRRNTCRNATGLSWYKAQEPACPRN